MLLSISKDASTHLPLPLQSTIFVESHSSTSYLPVFSPISTRSKEVVVSHSISILHHMQQPPNSKTHKHPFTALTRPSKQATAPQHLAGSCGSSAAPKGPFGVLLIHCPGYLPLLCAFSPPFVSFSLLQPSALGTASTRSFAAAPPIAGGLDGGSSPLFGWRVNALRGRRRPDAERHVCTV